MQNITIPFNRPFMVGKELFYIAKAVLGGHIAGDGQFTKKCQRLLEEKLHAKKVLLTHSCTAALEIAAILCDFKPGDEVIVPSFTFVSTANAFYMRGAKLVFADIHSDDLCVNVGILDKLITAKTRVIVPVHYAGAGCEMETIMSIAQKYDLLVVEDAAQGLNSKYGKKYLGTIGDLGALSFHETKNVISGEGGALIINNETYFERAEIIREKGTNRSKFYRGEIDKYTWVDIGSSFLPSDMIAAFLYAQLENIDMITARRKRIFDFYYQMLLPLVADGKLKIPPKKNGSNFHMFYILLNNGRVRDELMAFLHRNQIHAIFHYVPLHLSPIGRSMGYRQGDLPVTERISQCLLRLPFYYEITQTEQQRVVNSIIEFFRQTNR